MKKHLIPLVAAAILTGMTGQAFAGHGNDHHHGHGHGHHKHDHGKHGHSHGPQHDGRRFGDSRPAYGKVIAVKPIVRTVKVSTPRQTCWDEEVVHRSGGKPSVVPTVVGGVVGGVVGHQVGSGRTRDVTTVAGAVLGAAIGNDIGRQQAGGRTTVTTREHCRVVDETHREQQVEGYWVTYRYKGEKYTTRTERHPGETIRVATR